MADNGSRPATGKAYFDNGKWWVPWSGDIVPEGAQSKAIDRVWICSANVGTSPNEHCDYRIPATEYEIAMAQASPDWVTHSWGRERCVYRADDVEVWEIEGKAGHRTPLMFWPEHIQTLSVVDGVVLFADGSGNVEDRWHQRYGRNQPHEIRFTANSRLIRTLIGKCPATSTIIYQ